MSTSRLRCGLIITTACVLGGGAFVACGDDDAPPAAVIDGGALATDAATKVDAGPTPSESVEGADDSRADASDAGDGGDSDAACNEARLSWDGPTTNVDGTCSVDLAGFNVYWRLDAGADADAAIMVADAGLPCVPGALVPCGDAGQQVPQLACTYRVTGLADGTWIFTVTAYDDAGNESPHSAPAQKSIDCP